MGVAVKMKWGVLLAPKGVVSAPCSLAPEFKILCS